MADMVMSAEKLAEIASATTRTSVVQPLQFDQTTMKNELLLFIKPEVFLIERQELISKTVGLVFQKLAEFGARADGIVIMTGAALQESGAMNKHYGLINRLSTSASKMITRDEEKGIVEELGIAEAHPTILGGHEFLSRIPDLSVGELDTLWLSERSTKLRSGFYVRPLERDGQTIVLVNGFHPQQLEHYTSPSHRILLVLLHADTDWSVLKYQMVGSTFPDRAESTSIRGTLYANPGAYGFDEVGIANNAVHLSAGPFEAMFESFNFFGDVLGVGPDRQQPLVLRRMLDGGIASDLALSVLQNPTLADGAEMTDLFTATEDMNTDDAITYWREHAAGTR